MTNTITIDERFTRNQLEHGLVIAAAVPALDQLILVVPRAGRTDVVRVTWPGIQAVEISDGAFRVIDARSRVTMADLHSHLLTGSLDVAQTTRDELIARVSTSSKAVRGRSRTQSTDGNVHIAELSGRFGLADRWKLQKTASQSAPALNLPKSHSLNLDALSDESARVVLVLDSNTNGRGHLYLENAPYASTVFAIGAAPAGSFYFVTGPQRSGTTFLSHAISYDLGLPHIDEFDHYDPDAFFSYLQFREMAVRSRSWVAQAPSLFHCLSDLRRDFPSVVPVVCLRGVDDIVASQQRVGWGEREENFERRQLGIPAADQRPISEIKYERWNQIKKDFEFYIEVSFEELQQHPLYATTRSEFGAKQWS